MTTAHYLSPDFLSFMNSTKSFFLCIVSGFMSDAISAQFMGHRRIIFGVGEGLLLEMLMLMMC